MQDKASEGSVSTVEEESEMFYKAFKWKNICLLFVMIFLFHIVLTICMSKYSALGDDQYRDEEDIYMQSVINTEHDISLQKIRKKRDVDSGKNSTEFKSPYTTTLSKHKYSADTATLQINPDGWSNNGLCQNGHAQDIITHCEAVGCLRKLRLPPTHEPVSYLDGRVSKEFLYDIQRSQGRLQKIHIDLISLLTDIQWGHGIFGSIAVLGDQTGFMTKLMAANADISEGENMLIVSEQDVWKYFSVLDSSLKHNIHHCPGYSNFSKMYLLQHDIPQFRFVSISSDDSFHSLVHLMQITACVIREGGILVLDNFKPKQLTEFVQKYYRANGYATIKPLLAANSKVYFSSPRWKPIYTEKLLHSQSNFVALHLQMSPDNLFHSSGSYLLSSS